jgi:diguanylate cyclase (GGDEF)-like protein/PAS domain S-box-containing protein
MSSNEPTNPEISPSASVEPTPTPQRTAEVRLPSAAERSRALRVEAALVQLLYQFAPVGFLASAVSWVILGAVLWQELSSLPLFVWFVICAAVIIAHCQLWRWFAAKYPAASVAVPLTMATDQAGSAIATSLVGLIGQDKDDFASKEIGQWRNRFVTLQIVCAAIWGVLALFFLPQYNMDNRLSVVTLLIVFTTGAIAYLAPNRVAFRWLALIVLLPLAYKLAMSGVRSQMILSAALLGFAVVLIFLHARLHNSIRQALGMNMEREHTARALAGEQNRVRAANAALADEIIGRLRAEQSERDARERLSMHLERTPLGVVDLDAQGVVLQWNPAAHALFGRSEAEVKGRKLSDALIAENERKRFDILVADVMESRESAQATFACLTPSGKLIHCEFNSTPLINAEQRVVGLAAMIQDVSERLNTDRTIQYMALHDALTGLPNRRLLQDRLTQAIAQARRMQRFIALLSVDLDRFKLINEAVGRDQGDQVLKEMARRLKATVRDHDTVAREGGDEFIIMLTELEQPEQARSIADKITRELAKPIAVGSRDLHVTVSVGISHYPSDAADAQQLLKHADSAMYNAKESGRNTVRVFTSDLHELMKKRLDVEARLRKGIEQKSFVLRYQPQFETATGRVIGCEALLRWHDADFGEIYPDDFIYLAEELGLTVQLGEWVINEACAQQMRWLQAGLKDFRISINLSPRQFLSRKLIGILEGALQASGAIPEMIDLEIAENVIMRNLDQAVEVLTQVQGLGLRVTVDDFGLGYSSLTQLSRVPADSLKLDKSFLDNVPDDRDAAASADAIIAMARRLKWRSIAEGVELQAQLDFLRSSHCDVYQGFLSGAPMTADEVLDLANK